MTDAKGRAAPAATRIDVPGGPGGSIRRKIPAPFARPSISIGDSGPRREWRRVAADELKIGDIVPSVGRLVQVHEEVYVPSASEYTLEGIAELTSWTVTVIGVEGTVRVYQGHEVVFAFVFPVEEECTSTSSLVSAAGEFSPPT